MQLVKNRGLWKSILEIKNVLITFLLGIICGNKDTNYSQTHSEHELFLTYPLLLLFFSVKLD